jgi:hypothetical protein
VPRWAENKGLTLKDMREMHNARIVAQRAGRPLNGFLTMTPYRSVPDCERRVLLQDQRSRLGQRLKRLDLEFIGLFVREKKADDVHDAGEHGAALLWLPKDIETETLLRCLSRDIDAQLDWNNGEAGIKARLDYLQKERCGQAEGYLKKSASLRYPWEAPAPLISPRWSMSQGLAALVAADAEQHEPRKIYRLGWKGTEARALAHEAVAKPEPISSPAIEPKAPEHPKLQIVVDNALTPEPVQLSLFPLSDRPVSRLSNYACGIMPAAVAQEVEARRHWRGLTQAKLAEHIGLSRPQLVNALHGRFGLSNWAACRLREYLLLSQTLRAA